LLGIEAVAFYKQLFKDRLARRRHLPVDGYGCGAAQCQPGDPAQVMRSS
jgi:hypothetical protein